MSRKLMKEFYLEQKEFECDGEREKMEKYYEAHHIAELHPLLMDHPENCIMLWNEEDGKELLDFENYTRWLKAQFADTEISKVTDIVIVKSILKPIKKELKALSKSIPLSKSISLSKSIPLSKMLSEERRRDEILDKLAHMGIHNME